MKKRILSLALSLALGVGLLVLPAGAEFTRSKTYTAGQFTDVAANAWYATSVKDCYELGLMSGSSATTFDPAGMFTLAEAATIAARMHNIYNGGNGDIPAASGAWYQGAVNYCIANGIFAADTFDSYTRCATRAEMAGIIAAALPDEAWVAKNSVSALPDVNRATTYANAIFKLYDAGVFTGSDAYGKFQPYANITRAEVAAIVARCADQSQRKTLNLKPLSQREAPVIIGGYNADNKMSNGRLKFQDPDTKKWGYLDGSGNVAIAAQYDSAEDFEDGYAVVGVKVNYDWKYGLINTSGVAVIPLEHQALEWQDGWGRAKKNSENGYALIVNGKVVTQYSYNLYELKRANESAFIFAEYYSDGNWGSSWSPALVYTGEYGVLNDGGKEIIPPVYNRININPSGFIAMANDHVDVYDTSGKLLQTIAAEKVETANGNRLIAVQEGNKWGLFSPTGRICDAIFDDITIYAYSDWATVEYGNKMGLYSLNGEVMPLEEGDISVSVNGDYVLLSTDGNGLNSYSVRIYSMTGLECEIERGGTTSAVLYGVGPNGTWFHFGNSGRHWVWQMLVSRDRECVKVYAKEYERFYIWENEVYGEKIYSFMDTETGELYDDQAPWDETIEHIKALGLWVEPEQNYKISSADGKPIVTYGNDEAGWTPVIEFYKNNLYYDEIKDIGEGYYACRYNTTWYLVHAN